MRRRLASFLVGGPSALLLPAALSLVLIVYPYLSGNQYWIGELPLILTFALVVSGVNLSWGYAGELQLGQVFMFALGAYIPMILATQNIYNEIIPLMLLGGVLAVIAGVVIALPALRIGGWSLAMTSFFLVITIPDLASIFINYTGGLNGLTGIPNPSFFGHTLGPTGLYEITAVTTIVWFVMYRNLVTSRYGVVFRTLRESPILCKSLRFSTMQLKATVYALGALPAGLAGCLYGYLTLILEPSSFGLTMGIGTVAASLLGGPESIYGVFIGAAILQLGPIKSASFAAYSPVVYGFFLIAAAVMLRGGVARYSKIGLARIAKLLDPTLVVGDFVAGSATVVTTTSDKPHGFTREVPSTGSESSSGEILQWTTQGKTLVVSGVTKSFGGVKALKNVSIVAKPGEITSLIGSNGSGKTTLLNVICGYEVPDSGSVTLDGSELVHLKPHQIARRGVGRTFQTPSIPRGITVLDAVASGRYASDKTGFVSAIFRFPRYWRSQRADRREAMSLLGLVGLSDVAHKEAASLPLGSRRLIEVVRTLCANPAVILLDEPASGLNDKEIEMLVVLVKKVAQSGAAVIIIEHNFRFIGDVSNVINVLHFGQLIATGSHQEVAANRQVIESYLGETKEPRDRSAALKGARSVDVSGEVGSGPRLAVDALEAGYGDLKVLRGVSVRVPPASIEVVLGRNGVGKTTLLLNVAGLLKNWKGSITLDGRPLRHHAYRRAADGVVLVQEGKRIFRQRTVWQNLMLGTYSQKVSRTQREAICRQVIEEFPILKERLNERAGGLSGGQQQMLAIAQALAARPRVLLLDEPSAGLAPAIVDELFGRLRHLADEGLSILLVEQLAEKALSIADHVTVMDGGKVIAHGGPEEFSEAEKLTKAYFGL